MALQNHILGSFDLLHPRICIFHIAERLVESQILSNKYLSLGAVVTLREIADGRDARHHSGRLYYFDKSPRVVQIARIIAKDVAKFEIVCPRFVEMHELPADFAIYLVKPLLKKPRILLKAKNSTIIRLKSRPKQSVTQPQFNRQKPRKEKVFCLWCKCLVRESRFNAHVRKVHKILTGNGDDISKNKSELSRKKKSIKRIYVSTANKSNALSDHLLGQPVGLGWGSSTTTKTLRPKNGVKVCRICKRPSSMYNSGECYECNPK